MVWLAGLPQLAREGFSRRLRHKYASLLRLTPGLCMLRNWVAGPEKWLLERPTNAFKSLQEKLVDTGKASGLNSESALVGCPKSSRDQQDGAASLSGILPVVSARSYK